MYPFVLKMCTLPSIPLAPPSVFVVNMLVEMMVVFSKDEIEMYHMLQAWL